MRASSVPAGASQSAQRADVHPSDRSAESNEIRDAAISSLESAVVVLLQPTYRLQMLGLLACAAAFVLPAAGVPGLHPKMSRPVEVFSVASPAADKVVRLDPSISGCANSFTVDFTREFQGGLILTIMGGKAGQEVKIDAGESLSRVHNRTYTGPVTEKVGNDWGYSFTWKVHYHSNGGGGRRIPWEGNYHSNGDGSRRFTWSGNSHSIKSGGRRFVWGGLLPLHWKWGPPLHLEW